MTRAEIEALAERWMAFWRGGDLDDFPNVHAPDFVDRSAGERGTDRAAFAEGLRALYRAFPDFRAETTFVAVDEAQQLAMVRWTATGTHAGPFLGAAPTGRVIAFEGIEMIRCKAGRVAERWGEWNGLEIEAQLRG